MSLRESLIWAGMYRRNAGEAKLIPLDPPELRPSGIKPWPFALICILALILGAALWLAVGL